jgi:hypothetical protein
MDSRVINFNTLHMDVLLNRFDAQLPVIFLTKDEEKENKPKCRKKKKQKSKEKEDGKKGNRKKKTNAIANIDQIFEFKMHEGKSWEKTFQGQCPKKQVKMLGVFMCLCFHTREKCWEGCKSGKTHLPAREIPKDKKEEYKAYMVCMCSTEITK